MATISYVVPTPGTDLNALADPEIATALTTLKTAFNGNIDAVNLSALLAQAAGVNQNAQVVKGAVNNVGPGTRTNVAYGALSDAADQVQSIVLSTNGMIRVWYQALWQESVAGAARAAIFLGANQLQVQSIASAGPATEAAATGSVTAAINVPLHTLPIGLASVGASGGFSADATTGQAIGVYNTGGLSIVEIGGTVHALFSNAGNIMVGGSCNIKAAAGTYTVSVQFKASSGTVTASNRLLVVQAISPS